MAVGAVRRIDPYGEGLPAHVESTHRIDDESAGAVLVVGGHRVLEVEDELVRVELGGLGEEPLAGAGNDVDAPSGTGAFHPCKVARFIVCRSFPRSSGRGRSSRHGRSVAASPRSTTATPGSAGPTPPGRSPTRSSGGRSRRRCAAASRCGSRPTTATGPTSASTSGWRAGSSSTTPPRATGSAAPTARSGTGSRSASRTAGCSRCATSAGSGACASSPTSRASAPTPRWSGARSSAPAWAAAPRR